MISDFQVGEEKMRIERPGGTNSPVWSMAWNPSKYVAHDSGADKSDFFFCRIIHLVIQT